MQCCHAYDNLQCMPSDLPLLNRPWLPQVLGNIIVLKVGMEDFNVSGKMRVTMRPLLDRTPVVGALKVGLSWIKRRKLQAMHYRLLPVT